MPQGLERKERSLAQLVLSAFSERQIHLKLFIIKWQTRTFSGHLGMTKLGWKKQYQLFEGKIRGNGSDCVIVWVLHCLRSISKLSVSILCLAWPRVSVEEGRFQSVIILMNTVCTFWKWSYWCVLFDCSNSEKKPFFTLGEKSGDLLLRLSEIAWNNWQWKKTVVEKDSGTEVADSERLPCEPGQYPDGCSCSLAKASALKMGLQFSSKTSVTW